MKSIKKELDRLVQQLSHNHLCHICRKPKKVFDFLYITVII